MKRGFTMFMNGKDYFFITTCKSKNSKILLDKICRYFNTVLNENTEKFLKSRLLAATLEYKSNCFVIDFDNGQIVTPYGDENTILVSFTQKNRTLNTKENVAILKEALETAKKNYAADPNMYHVSISKDNEKTNNIISVSTLPYILCPACTKNSCGKECYAMAMALYGQSATNIRAAWARNTAIYLLDPEKYFREVSAAACMERYFRFHVSGDIIDKNYFSGMIKVTRENPKTEFLAFTKNYKVINDWIRENGPLPENLHILFSAWEDKIVVDNPYNLPETDVLNETDRIDNGYICGGNCSFCACVGVGCWQLKNGQKLYFYKH